jgi:hypothetical protein
MLGQYFWVYIIFYVENCIDNKQVHFELWEAENKHWIMELKSVIYLGFPGELCFLTKRGYYIIISCPLAA